MKIKKPKDLEYKIDFELILYGIEPFTNISTKIINFLDDIGIKHNLISHYSWKVIDDKKETGKLTKQLKKLFKYLGKKITEYRNTHEYRDD